MCKILSFLLLSVILFFSAMPISFAAWGDGSIRGAFREISPADIHHPCDYSALVDPYNVIYADTGLLSTAPAHWHHISPLYFFHIFTKASVYSIGDTYNKTIDWVGEKSFAHNLHNFITATHANDAKFLWSFNFTYNWEAAWGYNQPEADGFGKELSQFLNKSTPWHAPLHFWAADGIAWMISPCRIFGDDYDYPMLADFATNVVYVRSHSAPAYRQNNVLVVGYKYMENVARMKYLDDCLAKASGGKDHIGNTFDWVVLRSQQDNPARSKVDVMNAIAAAHKYFKAAQITIEFNPVNKKYGGPWEGITQELDLINNVKYNTQFGGIATRGVGQATPIFEPGTTWSDPRGDIDKELAIATRDRAAGYPHRTIRSDHYISDLYLNGKRLHGNPCEFKITDGDDHELLNIKYKDSEGVEKNVRIRDNITFDKYEGLGLYPNIGPNYTTLNDDTIILN